MEDNCVFCKIIRRDLPSYIVYENDNVISFLDIDPTCFAHTLVVPKIHVRTIMDFNDEDLSVFIVEVKHVSKMLINILNADGFKLTQNNGETSGQVVPHVHIHIKPSFKIVPPIDKNDIDKVFRIIKEGR